MKDQLHVGLGGDVPVLPPFIALALLAVAGVFEYYKPKKMLPEDYGMNSLQVRVAAFVGACAGCYYILVHSTTALNEAGSGVEFTLVNGIATDVWPYTATRNPMYMCLVYLVFPAFAVLLDSKWFLFLMSAMFFYLDLLVIPAEERLLGGLFGAEYEDYVDETPRWFTVAKKSRH